MTRAYIGLGANLGEPQHNLSRALKLLDATDGIRVTALSPAYRTEPWGNTGQPPFLNAVAELVTSLDARQLLDALLDIESRLGRVRNRERWGPRLIDLDLLVFGDQAIDQDGLTVPHPRLAERAFVLVPLAALAPGLDIPGHGRADDLLARLDRHSRGTVVPAEPLVYEKETAPE